MWIKCGMVAVAGSMASVGMAQDCVGVASYEVRFDAEWSQATHPAMFPGNPHFSPLIGATHGAGVSFWSPGVLASPGIELMAETGQVGILRNEVNAAIAAGTAGGLLQGGVIDLSPGEVSMSFEAEGPDRLLTLVTMIAPSPDWFVGVHGLPLWDADGWREFIEVDLWPYDSGTDSGVSYSSPNADTNPQQPIRLIADESPFVGTGRIGTMTITLTSLAVGCSVADYASPCGVLDFNDLAAFLTFFNSRDPAADLSSPDGVFDFFDVAAFLTGYTNGCP